MSSSLYLSIFILLFLSSFFVNLLSYLYLTFSVRLGSVASSHSQSVCRCFRCVPDNKRAFASGVQYMSWKTLGFLPGPILFGHILDSYCRLWQDTCGKKGRCFDYDIDGLSYAVCIMGCTISCEYIASGKRQKY